MTTAQTAQPTVKKPLRLWPGVTAAVLLAIVVFGLPLVLPEAGMFVVLGGALGTLMILLWWLFFSRAPWLDRLTALVLMIVAIFAARPIVHESIRGGMMGMMLPVYALPVLSLALVAWAVASRRLAAGPRRAALVATMLLACAVWTLVRTDGITGEGAAEFRWRWTETPEQRLLAQTRTESVVPSPVAAPAPPPRAADPAAPKPATEPPAMSEPSMTRVEWPGFRGSARDGVIRGARIQTDWSKSPPVQLWRRPIGPGWSSFAVRGDLLYTQEQRGDDEIVACYSAKTGHPVWIHRDQARFWESNAGAGPRATPTLSDGHVYSLGATGILNSLDAGTGAVVWSRNAATDTAGKVPYWGFSSSPLVVGDTVIVYAGGLAAYDRASGSPRWIGKAGGDSYSSPHLVTIDGVAQVVQLTGAGATSVAPADGTLLWEHAWPGDPIVQPAVTADGDVLIATGGGTGPLGLRRLAIARGPNGWTAQERWTSNGLKPYFNDFVVHEGHAFGFDGRILSCIGLEDGARKWKGGRYGSGQLVLLPDLDLLLVLSEEGELALVKATPDQFTEVARFPAIEGKTWNHPVLAGDVLLVRNGEEMAAFRLPVTGR